MNLIGKMLNNRYEILEKIGNGGMATVYKAKCHVLNRYVAIKILRDEFTTDSEFIKKFNTEAQSAASLTHPNIVSIYDVGNEDNLYYIVMELIQGKTLKDIITEDGVLSWKWSVNIAIQIASALETAHKNNIIHRDIKPHNIIITEDGMAKVTDFGIAKAVSNSTITAFGTTIGSVHYFSPEHARGGYTDAKSDIYSLGIVMYEMLTGKVPFDADTPVSVALKQVQEEPVEPIKINPNIPIGVNRIILKAMQKDPNIRYQNATEMLQDLSMALKKPNEDFVVLARKNANSPTQKVPTIYEIEMEKNNERNAPKLGEGEEETGGFKQFLEDHPAVKVILAIIGCIAIFLIVTFGTLALFNGTRAAQNVMPNLAGYNNADRLSKEDAIALLEEAGFKNYEIKEEYSDEVPEGYVISQSPEYKENFNINVTEKVVIVISKGQKLVTLPKKMVGEKFEKVAEELDELEVTYEKTEEASEEVEAGIILSVEPEEGEEITAATIVKIKVSSGSAYADVTMKNLVGMSEADAVAWLNSQKVVPEVVYEENASKSDGVVTDQSVTSGKIVKEASTVTITVNRQPRKSTVTIKVNLQALTGYTPTTKKEYTNTVDANGNTVVKESEVAVTPNKVKLTLKVGEDTIYDQEQLPSETNITQTFSTTGVKEVKILVDGVTKKTETVDFSKGDATVTAP
ncbi:MAG: Stk1 family PASTA domain-containing Ser/Thr kinase [Clostridia bacterium]|nr:Stk1 family PASTA domain-containing Ser/Thr kinase [Clostridia bacterium]